MVILYHQVIILVIASYHILQSLLITFTYHFYFYL